MDPKEQPERFTLADIDKAEEQFWADFEALKQEEKEQREKKTKDESK